MAAMLVSLNKGTAAILVSPTNPLGIEPYAYANVFFCFGWKTYSLIMWVKTPYRIILEVSSQLFNKDHMTFVWILAGVAYSHLT